MSNDNSNNYYIQSPQRGGAVVSPEVLSTANNPFSNVNRFGGASDDDDDHHHTNHLPQQSQQQQPAPAVMSPKKAAEVARALALSNEQEREAALRKLYGDSGVFGNNNNGYRSPGNNNNYNDEFEENQTDEATSSLLNLPGGASSIDELLSRAAALDRECFDLQNEVHRWEKEIQECSQDINRSNTALNRYTRELNQVEQSVAELNGWFEDHTCANDPERYHRVSELNRDVCSLNMRIRSLESQLGTLLEGTMQTAAEEGLGPVEDNNNSSNSYRDSGNDLNNTPTRQSRYGDDDASRMAQMLQLVSPSSKNTNNKDQQQNKSHLVPVASPVRLPSNASSNSIKKYINELEQKTLEQDVLLLRLKEAGDKRNRLLDEERNNEMEIQALRQKLENAGIALPQAPIQHRTSRAIRKNQSQSAALAAAASAAGLKNSNGSDVTKRAIRLPSGILRDLTKELNASVRQVAHRCGVGEIAVEIANDATLLHCRGIVRAVNAFEDEVVAAAQRCKNNRALGGMVTYTAPQVAAVVADSTNKIAALLQPDSYNSPEKKTYW